jgi:hypothetical protein
MMEGRCGAGNLLNLPNGVLGPGLSGSLPCTLSLSCHLHFTQHTLGSRLSIPLQA